MSLSYMLAVEPGSKSSGIVLGSGVGVQYVEPGAAVALNNQLVAAQAEALAAEEAVLACLTQLVADRAEQLGALLDGVARLDAARARSRCGLKGLKASILLYVMLR